MTDRHAGYIVVLNNDMREDDAQATINAILQIKGVIEVKPIVQDALGSIAESRAKFELIEKIWGVLK